MVNLQPFDGISHSYAKGRSYRVTTAVGKIGAESPTFIKPVSERSDGIKAMFTKQLAQQHDRSTSPAKRERGEPEERGTTAGKCELPDYGHQMVQQDTSNSIACASSVSAQARKI
jgi:hypothetical protein